MTNAQTTEVRQALLLDLFRCADALLSGEDKRRFRVRHHEAIEVIDAMVSSGEIREHRERYSPNLTALASLTEPDVQDFLRDCDVVYTALRSRYFENFIDLVSTDELAQKANIQPVRFRHTLALLNDNISVVAGSQGNYSDPDYKVIPAEKVLTVPTFRQALEELRIFQATFGRRGLPIRHSLEEDASQVTAFSEPISSRSWIGALPDALHALMQEIYLALDSGLRALTAMGVRAAIDMTCNDLVGDVGGFEAKLKELVSLGHVSQLQRETLSAVINMGHASAHRGHIPALADIASIVDILERLLKSLYLDADTVQRIRVNTPSRER